MFDSLVFGDPQYEYSEPTIKRRTAQRYAITCMSLISLADLARAHVLALQYLLDGGETTAVNLASGHGASVREVIEPARVVTGAKIDARQSPRRPGDQFWWLKLTAHASCLDGQQNARTLLPSLLMLGAGTE